MDGFRYLGGVATLELDREKCTGCQVCLTVCPHAVFAVDNDRRVQIADLDACMECGACANNCAFGAITLTPGVGCAAAIIRGWVTNTEPSCGCSDDVSAPASACCGGAPVATGEPLGSDQPQAPA
ncbi:MAG: mercury methylation ferredoxin HgcB [Actinomycetota bacterium]|nr:MAG: hypothetical protein FD171_152 [Actinomycetota bacterium]MDO8950594.1 mercury methylation ferredoxin HgcB [Actinomycetota bacterium]MDP3629547.1 mercury methylation ferredoxin HgcB [Actinomycetota bacterium]